MFFGTVFFGTVCFLYYTPWKFELVNFVLQSQMLGASCLLYLDSATDDIGVDGPPPAEVGFLEGGNSTTLAEITHRNFPQYFPH